ncbi:MAG: hypothetical protein L7F77_10825 [Candidatus Magnetominusculus sp. LBB02]|nr:hypothetical protein [Candidatus Magnetominusculus sp. LBB02]
MLKKIFKIFIKILLILFAILYLITEACRDDVILDHGSPRTEIYFEGTGHSSEVILENVPPYHNTKNSGKLKLDNFTKDAYDIRLSWQHILDDIPYWRVSHYWLSFSFETFSTYCTEDNESNIMLPYILNSPQWWPRELGETIIPTIFTKNRSNYKFYLCRVDIPSRGYSYYEYFAIDNKTKKGYYWKTTRGSID